MGSFMALPCISGVMLGLGELVGVTLVKPKRRERLDLGGQATTSSMNSEMVSSRSNPSTTFNTCERRSTVVEKEQRQKAAG